MPAGIDAAGLISGFDEARRAERDRQLKEASGREDREFSILSALAQHTDPDIAAIGASALLGLVGQNGPKMQKGFRGFMGEVEKSTALAPLRQFLGAGSANAAPQPGSAAQPDTALVEPRAQAQARATGNVTPPTFGAPTPGTEIGAGVTPPTIGAPAPASAIGGTTPPEFGGAAGPPAPPLGLATPAGPPPPETPQQRSRRLFPSAADIAAETTYRNLKARLDAVMQAIKAAGGTQQDVMNATLGIAGAPRRAVATKPMNAQYRTADGQQFEGTVIFDPTTGDAEVDGQPVTILKMMPTNAPRPIRQRMNTDGTYTDVYLDPNTLEPTATVHTGIPVTPGPPPYSGTVTTDEGVFRLPRGAGAPEKVGNAPQKAGELTPEQKQATAWVTDVNAEAKAALSAFNQNRPSGMKATALPVQQQNAIVQKVTKGRYKTVGELTAATKREAGAPPSSGGTGSTMRDKANAVRQRLERGQTNRVEGSGIPQY